MLVGNLLKLTISRSEVTYFLLTAVRPRLSRNSMSTKRNSRIGIRIILVIWLIINALMNACGCFFLLWYFVGSEKFFMEWPSRLRVGVFGLILSMVYVSIVVPVILSKRQDQ
jgi:hypothetical protein